MEAGKAAVDDIKLKNCTACKLVKYCSVACQRNHRPQHKNECKKRAAEIKDDRLFTQPDESWLGECPICCLPLPLDLMKSGINSCCSKRICDGCNRANKKREWEHVLEPKCAYCREPLPDTEEEAHQNTMERAKVNDPIALFQMGVKCEEEGDYERAIQYYTTSAKLGEMSAHYNLSLLYQLGKGVEKDPKKELYHLEEAAIGGHSDARNNLGCFEEINGQINRATKHYMIAANLGNDGALEAVKNGFQMGLVGKEDYAAALRGHQAAVDATKSTQREEAERALQSGIYR